MKTILLFSTFILGSICYSQNSRYFNKGSIPDSINSSETILIYLAQEEKKEWLEKKLIKKNPEFKYEIVIAADSVALKDIELRNGYRYTLLAIKGPILRQGSVNLNSGNVKSTIHEYKVTLRDHQSGKSYTWDNKYSSISETFGPSQLFRNYILELGKYSVIY
ncbi:MAG: hypothetical protein ACJAUR_001317 [Ulvibacter sp.]|jgi:hypothetical protein